MSIHAKISQTGRTRCFTSHYDLDGIAGRVAEIYEMEVSDIFLIGKQQKRFTVQKKLQPLNEGGDLPTEHPHSVRSKVGTF
jgi:hypothetical protein